MTTKRKTFFCADVDPLDFRWCSLRQAVILDPGWWEDIPELVAEKKEEKRKKKKRRKK